MPSARRKIVLVQLPIPPVGHEPIRGNVPLAAGYLKLLARQRGLEADYDIEILPTAKANLLSDRGLVEAILSRGPWLVGFTCYLWNIDRSLWIAEQLKQSRPQLLTLLGGPEVTADNDWVLRHPAVDLAAIGEGEQTFAELLAALRGQNYESSASLGELIASLAEIDGLYVQPPQRSLTSDSDGQLPLLLPPRIPKFRQPLARLDDVSSPYLEGILDAADEQMLLLETIRGCVFKCKFCYYPKSYDSLYFVSREKIIANLRHAAERGAREVVLLDPTLNQRRDFDDFLRLLAEHNPGGQFTYFGELRAEGINQKTAQLLREANFTEVEIGLQSIDPLAQDLMDRKNNLKAFERGVQALLDVGIKTKVDLIVGLPGDTVPSVRRGVRYLRDSGLYSSVQVFNLAILPGTAFRQEAEQLGLKFSPRTPYYVVSTPTLGTVDLFDLMQEAQDEFDVEFDPLPPPMLDVDESTSSALRCSRPVTRIVRLNLDAADVTVVLPSAADRGQVFTLWLASTDFTRRQNAVVRLIESLLADNPHTTLQIVLEPTGDPANLTPDFLAACQAACYVETSYLDRFYSILPGRPKGAKRLVVVLTEAQRNGLSEEWTESIEALATIAVPTTAANQANARRQPDGEPLVGAP